jgi:hypothetical protein
MPLSSNLFLADVAAIGIRDGQKGSFGSGRLIAPGLVLTARHVTEFPKAGASVDTGWSVRLIRERVDGAWQGEGHPGKIVWRAKNPVLDLALVRIEDCALAPALDGVFASYDLAAPLEAVDAAGFPEAVWDSSDGVRDYTVRGTLRISSQDAAFSWTVAAADKPNHPQKWAGMSGSVVGREDAYGSFHLFGAVQEVPPNFTEGMLSVARLSHAFSEKEFTQLVAAASGMGNPPALVKWLPSVLSPPSTMAPKLNDIRKEIRTVLARRTRNSFSSITKE